MNDKAKMEELLAQLKESELLMTMFNDIVLDKDRSMGKIRGFEPVNEEHLKSYEKIEDIKMPLRGTERSAGYDFFASEDITIMPNDSVFIWTDIKAYMLADEVLEAYPRGSVGNKHKIRLGNTVGIIDADYYSNEKNDGNIGFGLYNYGKKVKTFKKGDAIIQCIFKKFLESDNCNTDIERTGGHGSTSEKESK